MNMVSLSGGCDSTCMLLMMLERNEPIADIVFFDWGREFPQIYEHLEKLEQYIGREITRLHSIIRGKQITWEDAVERYRYNDHPSPYPPNMWCSRQKIDGLNKHRNTLGEVKDCIGYVYDERVHRPKYKPWQRYPLLEWGVCKSEALKYCRSHGFDFGGLYDPGMFDRVSCWCCPNKNKRELQVMEQHFPEYHSRWVEMYGAKV